MSSRPADVAVQAAAAADMTGTDTGTDTRPRPQPVIAELLRTRYCAPGSVLLVEDVASLPTSRSGRWRALRLVLGDGELAVQALLSAEMHRYVDGGDVAVGAYVKLQDFHLEWGTAGAGGGIPDAEPEGADVEARGGKGVGEERDPKSVGTGSSMVYLIVDDLVTVGWDEGLLEMMRNEEDENTVIAEAQQPDDFPKKNPSPEPPAPAPVTTPAKPPGAYDRLLEELAKADEDDDYDDFETITVSEDKIAQRRAEVSSSLSGHTTTTPSNHTTTTPTTADPNPHLHPHPNRQQLPWHSTDPHQPLKLTPLKAIPTLPYAQNWSTNVLAVVSALTDVEPSSLPPYTQRQARLADPSTSKHVHLTVFLDAADFAPRVGAVVLLLGVKNHRFDGGSLKKYASDGRHNRDGGGGGGGRRWWYEDPTELGWCDVEGLRRWWDEGGNLEEG